MPRNQLRGNTKIKSISTSIIRYLTKEFETTGAYIFSVLPMMKVVYRHHLHTAWPDLFIDSSYHGGRELTDTVLEDEPVAFTVHEKGSKRGGRLLVSSDGFSYGVKVGIVTAHFNKRLTVLFTIVSYLCEALVSYQRKKRNRICKPHILRLQYDKFCVIKIINILTRSIIDYFFDNMRTSLPMTTILNVAVCWLMVLTCGSNCFYMRFQLKSQSSTLWTCSVRSKKMRCHATVRQVGDQFVRGLNAHCHPGDIKLPVRVKVSAEVSTTICYEYETK